MSLAYLEHYTVRDHASWKGDWELFYGVPYAMSPSPNISHQRLERAIMLSLDNSLQSCQDCEVLSELDWQCADDTVVRPDVLIACNLEGEKLLKTPELIVEIISKTTAKRDETLKFELYQKEGVKFYILVYPDLMIAKIYRLVDGRYIKKADFINETFDCLIRDCPVSIEFNKIWQ